MAQVPQGVGYQGVATDANGIELVNQSISIRASVLSGNANGTIEWEETHATSTDTFGLFTLTIGQGTNTTNGAQTSFADISWGTNTHFLKIEMDVTGGSNYSFMGTNQMMSVPYALYAESANINYDSISNLLSNDSTFITNIGGGMGGGCDFRYPEGLSGDIINLTLDNSNTYTVPLGKRLYISHIFSWNEDMFVDGLLMHKGIGQSDYMHIINPILVNSNQILSAGAGGNVFCNGILVDDNADINALTVQTPYTVPAGKNLYLTYSAHSGSSMNLNGVNIYNTSSGNPNNNSENLTNPLMFNEGDVIIGGQIINGYLVDENYFEDCGGGGSSSSAQFNNQISNYNNILDESITSGTFNYLYASWPTDLSFSYTVPAGKIMKITDVIFSNGSNSNPTYINGQLWHNSNNLPTLFSEGTQIEIQFDATLDATSVQYDLIENTEGIILNYLYATYPTDLSFNYTVPASKIMKITDVIFSNGSNSNPTYINGQLWHTSNDLPTLFSEGTQIEIQFDATSDATSVQYILFDN